MPQTFPPFEADFVADGELTIVHLPTGTRYFTYAASNPDEFYVLADGPGRTLETCTRVKPLLEQMLRHSRKFTGMNNLNRGRLFR